MRFPQAREDVERVRRQPAAEGDGREARTGRQEGQLDVGRHSGTHATAVVERIPSILGCVAGRRDGRTAALRLPDHCPTIRDRGVDDPCRLDRVDDAVRLHLSVEVRHQPWCTQTDVVGGDDGVALGEPTPQVGVVTLGQARTDQRRGTGIVESRGAVRPGDDGPPAFRCRTGRDVVRATAQRRPAVGTDGPVRESLGVGGTRNPQIFR